MELVAIRKNTIRSFLVPVLLLAFLSVGVAMTVVLSQKQTDVRSRASNPHPLNLRIVTDTSVPQTTALTASWIQYPNQKYLYRITDQEGKIIVLETTVQNEIVLDLNLSPNEYSFTVVCTEDTSPGTTRSAQACDYGTQDTLKFTVE